jgi:hypothetical protein
LSGIIKTSKLSDIGKLSQRGLWIVDEHFSIIPRLRGLKEITSVLAGVPASADTASMIRAFKQNMSLERVNFESHFIAEDDLTKMQCCCARNQCIHRRIQDPNAVPKLDWNTIFESALDYVHRNNVVFRGFECFGWQSRTMRKRSEASTVLRKSL